MIKFHVLRTQACLLKFASSHKVTDCPDCIPAWNCISGDGGAMPTPHRVDKLEVSFPDTVKPSMVTGMNLFFLLPTRFCKLRSWREVQRATSLGNLRPHLPGKFVSPGLARSGILNQNKTGSGVFVPPESVTCTENLVRFGLVPDRVLIIRSTRHGLSPVLQLRQR
jgi:hypothetical protein